MNIKEKGKQNDRRNEDNKHESNASSPEAGRGDDVIDLLELFLPW